MKYVKAFESFLNEGISHLEEVKTDRYVYHSSNPMFRNKIEREGIVPQGKSEAWLSDTKIDGKVIFAVNSENKEDWWDSTYDDDMYRIDTEGLKNTWYNDPNFDVQAKRIITFEAIPLDSIKLIYKGTGEAFEQFSYDGEDRLEELKAKYPNAIFTMKPLEKFKGSYFARVDIERQDGEKEYLGALKGPVTREKAIEFFEEIISKNYDKFY